jgi:transposase
VGDRRSDRIEAEADFLLAQIEETPDITLAELQTMLQGRGVAVGIGTVWRFFDRRGISFKKNRARRRAGST